MAETRTYPNVLELIGNTPLVKLDVDVPPTFLLKLEYLNPGGSVKDRSAYFMIREAEESGKLKPGGTIVEASSGNQGIALAMIGRLKGYRVIIAVPSKTAKEKVDVIRAYGAEAHVCPSVPSDDPMYYHNYARTLVEQTPGAFMPNQYVNKLNPQAHYSTTGPEIWEQTGGTVTHVFVGAGSCGTITGIGRYLKEQNPAIKIIGIDAAESTYSNPNPKPTQAEGFSIDKKRNTLEPGVVDQILTVTDDESFEMTRQIAKKYGIMGGLSSGAVMQIALQECKKLKPTDIAVSIFADSGRAYLSKVFATQEQHGVVAQQSAAQARAAASGT